MSGEVPEGWSPTTLGNVAAINAESLGQDTDPQFAFGYVDISCITQPGNCEGWAEMIFASAPSRARRKVTAGDALVSTVRPYLRAFARVPDSPLPLIASTGFATVRSRDGADQEFLFQHLMGDDFIKHLKPRMTGSNYPAVSAGDVADYPINLPPLDEQRRIAEVLGSVDEAILCADRNAQQQLKLWESLVEARVWLPALAQPSILSPLAKSISGSDYGVNAPLTDEAIGTPILRMGNLQGGQIDLANLKWGAISDDEAKSLRLRDGDILFNRTNSRDLVGKVALVRGEPEYLYASYLVRLSIDQSISDPYFVFAAMNSRRGQAAFKTIATPGVSQSNINPTNLKKLLFPLRDLATQKEIAEELRAVESARLASLAELASLRVTFSHLSSQLLSGRVRVPA